ncbi:MAG TPA: hypothetical protein VMR52_10805 [Dehalococcoidia bacterium]|nr:hypothetical protein [Dehalococcoidia bacterium]
MTYTAHRPGSSPTEDAAFSEVFDGLGVSVWIQDVSAVQAHIDALKDQGVSDFTFALPVNKTAPAGEEEIVAPR